MSTSSMRVGRSADNDLQEVYFLLLVSLKPLGQKGVTLFPFAVAAVGEVLY